MESIAHSSIVWTRYLRTSALQNVLLPPVTSSLSLTAIASNHVGDLRSKGHHKCHRYGEAKDSRRRSTSTAARSLVWSV